MLQKAVISYLEVYADSKLDLDKRRMEFEYSLRQYYRCKNNIGQNVLHIISKKCKLEMLNFVLDVLETKEVLRIVNEKDDEGNTPLMLACLYGSSDVPFELEEERLRFWKQKSDYIRDLVDIAGADLEMGLAENRMNPLHWAFYFGDMDTGIYLFKKCPRLLFLVDEEGQTPIELASQTIMRPVFRRTSIFLARSCVTHILETLQKNGKDFKFYLSQVEFTASELQDIMIPDEANKKKSSDKKRVNKIVVSDSVEFDAEKNRESTIQIQNMLGNDKKADVEIEKLTLDQTKAENLKETSSKEEKKKAIVISSNSKRNEFNQLLRILNIYLCIETYSYHFSIKAKAWRNSKEFLIEAQKQPLLLNRPQPNPERCLNKIIELITEYGINPFTRSLEGKSPFEHAVVLNITSLVDEFFNFRYFDGVGREIDIKSVLESKNIHGETALHLAAYTNNREMYDRLLKSFNLKPTFDNFHLLPEDNTQDVKFLKNKISYFNREEELKSLTTTDEVLAFLKENLQHESFNTPFAIAFIFSSEKDAELVGNQWLKFKPTSYSSWFDDTSEDGRESLIFINHTYDRYPSVAHSLKLLMFNKEKGYVDQFDKENLKSFTKFRDFHKHKLLLYLLNIEVNIEVYKSKGIIEEVVFLHDFKVRKKLQTSWQSEKWWCLLNSLYRPANSKISWPFVGISFYFGSDIGLCFNFYSMYIAFLCILGIISLFFTFWAIKHDGDYDNSLSPILGIIITIWLSITVQIWKRRESECIQVWRTTNCSQHELILPEYRGKKSVDARTNLIQKKDHISLEARQWITLIPLALFGLLLIAINFVIFTQLSSLIDDSNVKERIKVLLSVIVGLANGVSNNIFKKIFKWMANLVIRFENHPTKSSQEHHLIVKIFIFHFAVNYTNIFYYLFFESNFLVFSVNYVSTMVANDLYYFCQQRLIPWLIHLGKKKQLKVRIERARREETEEFLRKQKRFVEGKVTFGKQKTLSEFLNELLCQEQLQMNLTMRESPETEDIMLQYTSQLGYVAFFALSFPPAVLWCVFFNIGDLMFTVWAFLDHTKRKQCLEVNSLGFWNSALSAMCYISFVFNILVMMFGANGCYELLNIDPEDISSRWKVVIILFFSENILLIISYLIFTLIDSKPDWVRQRIENERLLLEKDNNEQINNIKRHIHFNSKFISIANENQPNGSQDQLPAINNQEKLKKIEKPSPS